MPTICWYLPLRESMSVTTVDTLCQRRRCIELSQFVIWFAQFFKGRLDIPYDNFQCYQRIVSYHTCTCLWTYLLYTSVSCLPMCRTLMFSALPSSIVQVNLTAFENELGVQAPVGFWDPVGFTADGDVATFKRRRSVELKHGRISMMATMGFLIAVHETSSGVFDGFCTFYRCDGDCWCEVDFISIRWFF